MDDQQYDVVIVGAGYTGLSAALTLARRGCRVCVIEADHAPGGLAGSFEFADGVRLEKFYHHWFNNDEYVPALVKQLGMETEVVTLPSRTGMYLNGRMWKLSTPLDLLRFTALPLFDRIRLGLLVYKVRRVVDWHAIEHLNIREWLEPLCGKTVYRVVWEPLIRAKFSVHAEAVNAVWFWKKLVLRGSTRDKKGGEQLAYFKGGFGRLAEAIVKEIRAAGGEVRFGEAVRGVIAEGVHLHALSTVCGQVRSRQFIFTPALPIIAGIFEGAVPVGWLQQLGRVRYLGNMCLVLRLKHSLSRTYWLNVNDPGFPFVGVIEHTNFDAPENYAGSRIAYISRYLAVEDPVWELSDRQYLDFALEHLQRMFPELDRSWVLEYRVWREAYAQPITERDYSQYVPGRDTPFVNGFISTMAQIYPEDRGTNYAIREGMAVADLVHRKLQ